MVKGLLDVYDCKVSRSVLYYGLRRELPTSGNIGAGILIATVISVFGASDSKLVIVVMADRRNLSMGHMWNVVLLMFLSTIYLWLRA